MENIIRELIKIENSARETMNEAEDGRKDLPRKLSEIEREIRERAERELSEKLAVMRAEVSGAAGRRLWEIEADCGKKTAALMKAFDEKKEMIEMDIFNRIIGR